MSDSFDEDWRRLSVREGRKRADWDNLVEGVPAWLHKSLIDWFREALDASPWSTQEAFLKELERALHRAVPWQPPSRLGNATIVELLREFRKEQSYFLNTLDWMLRFEGQQRAEELSRILREGGSAYEVSPRSEGSHYYLTRRVSDASRAAAERAMRVPRAGEHLAAAWQAAYGRNPDPSKAYREAVRAVEVAAISVVIPKDPEGTLGKVIVAIRDKPGKFKGTLGKDNDEAVRFVLEACRLLWRGQEDRHGTPDPEVPLNVSQPEAEAAVQLAALLVHWFFAGFFVGRQRAGPPRP